MNINAMPMVSRPTEPDAKHPFNQLRLAQLVACLSLCLLIGLGVFTLFRGSQANYLLFGADLYPRLIGTRAFWQGQSPYAPEIQREAEQLIYGRPRRTGEVTYLFQYPAQLVFVLTPLLVVPLEWVGVLWCAILTSILLTLMIVWSLLPTLRPAPFVWGIVLLTGLFYLPALSSILSGQYPLLILAFGFGAIALMLNQRDGLAGCLLAFATVKPSIGLFLPIIICLWALRWKRYRIVIGFGVTLALMLLITFLRIGWWIPDFLNQSQVYEQINSSIDLAWSAREILTVPGMLWLVSSFALLGIGIVALWSESNFPWLALFGALSLNLIVMPHSLEYDLTMFLFVLLWLGWHWREQWWGIWAWIILMWVPWLLWLGLRSAEVTAPDAWKALWQIYPTLLIAILLLWWAKEKFRKNVTFVA